MSNVRRVGFLGPVGTFTHEALRSQEDLAALEAVAYPTIGDVVQAVANGECELAVVPLENAIEGTVSATLDSLIFENDLFIQREIVRPIQLHLMARPGVALSDVSEVWSYTHALAQCRNFLATLGSLPTTVSASTADAARLVAELNGTAAAVAPAVAAELYGLTIVASDVEDHEGNETKFVVVGRSTVPKPTGHDRTTIVCFQDADRPGSLYGILGRFAARDLNLTKLESRPTKRGLGDYCFVIELEGHVADDVVGDCLADLQAHLTRVKFLGSYPVTGDGASEIRESVSAARVNAAEWVAELRRHVEQ
jgi:prephenate dehydratase